VRESDERPISGRLGIGVVARKDFHGLVEAGVEGGEVRAIVDRENVGIEVDGLRRA
jgi:hypothetical protein